MYPLSFSWQKYLRRVFWDGLQRKRQIDTCSKAAAPGQRLIRQMFHKGNQQAGKCSHQKRVEPGLPEIHGDKAAPGPYKTKSCTTSIKFCNAFGCAEI